MYLSFNPSIQPSVPRSSIHLQLHPSPRFNCRHWNESRVKTHLLQSYPVCIYIYIYVYTYIYQAVPLTFSDPLSKSRAADARPPCLFSADSTIKGHCWRGCATTEDSVRKVSSKLRPTPHSRLRNVQASLQDYHLGSGLLDSQPIHKTHSLGGWSCN